MEAKILEAAQKRGGKEDEIHLEDLLHDSDNDNDDDNAPAPGSSDDVFPGSSNGPQTGPKGVKEDYRLFKLQEWNEKQEKKKLIVEQAKKKAMLLSLDIKYEEDESEDDLLKDDFLNEYHLKRLQDMRISSTAAAMQKRKAYGGYHKMTAETFATDLDSEPPNVLQIVHIYTFSSSLLHQHLKQIALSFGRVKFWYLSHQEAPHFDQQVLPALLFYKSGELKHSVFRITDEITSVDPMTGSEYEYSYDTVERFLLSLNVFTEDDHYEFPQVKTTLRSLVYAAPDDIDSDDD